MALTEGDKANLAIQRKTALIDHINLIPLFSGESQSVSYADFKRAFERLASLYGWEEEEKIFVLYTRVTGAAAQLLRVYENEKKTYAELCKILSSRYHKKDSPSVALQKFLTFKQLPSMSVQEFYDRAKFLSVSAIVVEGGDQEIIKQTRTDMLKSMLLSNLSPEIKKGVIAQDPKTPEDILKIALLEEKSWQAVRADTGSHALLTLPSAVCEHGSAPVVCAAARSINLTSANKEKDNELKDLKEQVKLLTEQVATLVAINTKTAQSSNNKREIICFRCSKAGHYARECRSNNNNNQRNNWSNNRGKGNYKGGYNNNNNSNRENSNGSGSGYQGGRNGQNQNANQQQRGENQSEGNAGNTTNETEDKKSLNL